MSGFVQDLRYALRCSLRNHGFTFAVVGMLALGIGFNAALFSIINAMLWIPYPFADPDRLMVLREVFDRRGGNVSYPDFLDFRAGTRSLEQVTAFQTRGFTLTGTGSPELIIGAVVAPDFLDLLGVRPALGRSFLPREADSSKVVVISHDVWLRWMGGDTDVLGKTLTLNREIHTIVGVLPHDFFFFTHSLLVPGFSARETAGRADRSFGVLARLRSDRTVEQANAELVTIARMLEHDFPMTNLGWGARAGTLRQEWTSYSPAMLLPFLGGSGFLLLIACLNAATVLLARGAMRAQEMAVRTALGAGRVRLVRQLGSECMVLSAVAGGAGLALAAWSLPLVTRIIPQNMAQAAFPGGPTSIGLDSHVVAFTIGISVLTALAFGLAPALVGSRPDLLAILRSDSARVTPRRRGHDILMIVEIALSLVLLSGAGLMVESFVRIERMNRGIDWSRVVRVGVPLAPDRYPDAGSKWRFVGEMLQRLERIPGVECAAASAFRLNRRFMIEQDGADSRLDSWVVSPSYFRAMAIPRVRGRGFTDDDRERAPAVAIINQSAASRLFHLQNPIGKRIRPLDAEVDSPWLEIVGVVGDTQWMRIPFRPFELEAQPAVYRPYAQSPGSFSSAVVRAIVDPKSLVRPVARAIWEIDHEIPLHPTAGMENFASELERPRLNLVLLGLFAGAALFLSALGVYAVVSYAASERTHEVGIRMALGARPAHILTLVVGRGLALALVGTVLGLAGSAVLSRFVQDQLYQVRPMEPLNLAIASLLLLVAAILASYIPARRAARLDPVAALRSE